MSLKVIGAGFGRTGTESLKLALEQLGFDKCYHMGELFRHPHHIVYWEKLFRGEPIDFQKLFQGYQAAVDLPSNLNYKKLMEEYPNAKVILTLRDVDKWYESASRTIFKKRPAAGKFLLRLLSGFSSKPRYILRILKFIDEAAMKGMMHGRTDEKSAKATFEKWNQDILEYVPKERLLVYRVQEGWEPLCRFLNVPVPDTPFPHSNTRHSFKKRNTVGSLVKGGKALK